MSLEVKAQDRLCLFSIFLRIVQIRGNCESGNTASYISDLTEQYFLLSLNSGETFFFTVIISIGALYPANYVCLSCQNFFLFMSIVI